MTSHNSIRLSIENYSTFEDVQDLAEQNIGDHRIGSIGRSCLGIKTCAVRKPDHHDMRRVKKNVAPLLSTLFSAHILPPWPPMGAKSCRECGADLTTACTDC